MEFLHGAIVVVAIGASLLTACLALVVSYFLVQVIWPVLMGIGGGYLLWTYVDNELGYAFAVFCLFGQIWWWQRTREHLPKVENPPQNGNKNPYNEEGHFPDYYDLY